MALLWSRHVTYPSCRQCPWCNAVFTFTADQVVAVGGVNMTPCQECNAPVPVDAGAGLTDVPTRPH